MKPLGAGTPGGWRREGNADPEAAQRRRRGICLMLLGIHRLQLGVFVGLQPAQSRSLAPSASQEILLDLYLAGLESRQVYQSCLAGNEPPATIHRLAARLEKLGAVSRAVDPHDHRRLNVTLTPAMRDALDAFIDAVDSELRHGLTSTSRR